MILHPIIDLLKRIVVDLPEYVGPSGGGSGWELLADHTTTEDVSSIQIDFTSAMQRYDYYSIVLDGQFDANEYPCPAFNSEPATEKYMPIWQANQTGKGYISVVPIRKADDTILHRAIYTDLNQANLVMNITFPISYFKVAVYYSHSHFKTGFNVKVYGVMMP